jgi:hypothetical protein
VRSIASFASRSTFGHGSLSQPPLSPISTDACGSLCAGVLVLPAMTGSTPGMSGFL